MALSHCPSVLRWANGLHDEKPLSVPRDAHFQLETCPLTAVDALGNTQPGPQSPPQLLGGLEQAAEAPVPCSPAVLSGIPVVHRLCCVLGWCVPLHRGLLFCAGPSPGDQHRCVLVPAHSGLLFVSFPWHLACGREGLRAQLPCPSNLLSMGSPAVPYSVPESEDAGHPGFEPLAHPPALR